MVLYTLAGLGSWETGRITRTGDGADRKGNSSRVKLEILKFTEPVGQE